MSTPGGASPRGCPRLDLTPFGVGLASPVARSDLAVSHRLAGFLHRPTCRLVASCCRPWGSSGFTLRDRRCPAVCARGLPSDASPSRACPPVQPCLPSPGAVPFLPLQGASRAAGPAGFKVLLRTSVRRVSDRDRSSPARSSPGLPFLEHRVRRPSLARRPTVVGGGFSRHPPVRGGCGASPPGVTTAACEGKGPSHSGGRASQRAVLRLGLLRVVLTASPGSVGWLPSPLTLTTPCPGTPSTTLAGVDVMRSLRHVRRVLPVVPVFPCAARPGDPTVVGRSSSLRTAPGHSTGTGAAA